MDINVFWLDGPSNTDGFPKNRKLFWWTHTFAPSVYVDHNTEVWLIDTSFSSLVAILVSLSISKCQHYIQQAKIVTKIVGLGMWRNFFPHIC